MSDKEFTKLMELAQKQLHEEVTPEKALKELMLAGILDANGNYTEPYQELAKASNQ